MTTAVSVAASPPSLAGHTRWAQLIIGIIAMIAIANLQYGWTLFVGPMNQKFHWGRTDIQVAFSIFALLETWLAPLEGHLVDRFGPRRLVALGGLLVGAAWAINSMADALALLYLGAAVGGAGLGVVYSTSVGNALKWFPDCRGLAAGRTAAAFGAGSALTIIPISRVIQSYGYQSAFLWFGIGQGLIVFLCAFLLRAPRIDAVPEPLPAKVLQAARHFTWLETVQSPAFWLLYVMFTA